MRFESFQLDAHFERLRTKIRALNLPPKQLPNLSSREGHILVTDWFIERERDAERWWVTEGQNLGEEEVDEARYNLRIDEGALTGGSRLNEPDYSVRALNELLTERGLAISDADLRQEILSLFHRARLENVRRSLARIDGRASVASDPSFNDAFAHTERRERREFITVSDLLDRFKEANVKANRAGATIRTYSEPARLLREGLGANTSLHSVTRTEVARLMETLRRAPTNATKRYPGLSLEAATAAADEAGDPSRLSSKSQKNYFGNIVTIFKFAVERGFIDQNPATDRLLLASFNAPSDDEPKVVFTVDELNRLFRSPLYIGCRDDEMGFAKPGPNRPRRGRFWLPLIALFNGLRSNEAGQLYTEDVVEQEGVLCVRVRRVTGEGAASEKRVKNRQSERLLPVHPEVLRIGFREFVETRRHAPSSPRLFPELVLGATGYFSDPFGKWFARFVDRGIGEECKATFHSFRHHFRQALEEVGLPIPDVELLGGWKEERGSAEREYRSRKNPTGARLLRLSKGIASVKYPGLDLTHLYRD